MSAAMSANASDQPLVAAYATWDGRLAPRSGRTVEARRFLRTFGSLPAWAGLPLAQQLTAPVWARTLVAWAALTGRLAVEADYVVACNSMWGTHSARLHPEERVRFDTATAALGFTAWQSGRQWSILTKIAVIEGAGSPLALSGEQFETGRETLFAATRRHRRDLPHTASTPAHGLAATLFHLGLIDHRPGPKPRTGIATRHSRWQRLERSAPQLAATMRAYLEQIALSLRPGSLNVADTSLRTFATWLATHHPDVGAVAELRRTHIEDYKTWLAQQRGYRRDRLAPATIASRLGDLRAFFDRLIEWDWTDAPTRPLIFAGDLPIGDQPLPRFLDDPDAAALLRAARAHPDPLVRLIVELLARPGLRKGELLGLTVDAVVQIGTHHWLRVPVGKLHTDRYVPLHPELKAMLDEWLADRPTMLRSDLLLVERGPWPRRASTAPSPTAPPTPASATSPLISCAPPWPPKPSTAACR